MYIFTLLFSSTDYNLIFFWFQMFLSPFIKPTPFARQQRLFTATTPFARQQKHRNNMSINFSIVETTRPLMWASQRTLQTMRQQGQNFKDRITKGDRPWWKVWEKTSRKTWNLKITTVITLIKTKVRTMVILRFRIYKNM